VDLKGLSEGVSMIIAKSTAIRLMLNGKAKKVGSLKPNDKGVVYAILDRYDKQRTDHFQVKVMV
jgi:hypothetical protein